MIALIMAGGQGTRFWPQSRTKMPKQFLKVAGERSMIQLTVDRLLPIIDIRDIYVVTAKEQIELVKEHLPELDPENIIPEPFGMNTAPCIALSVAYLKERYVTDIPMLVLPADHVIQDGQGFRQSLQKAAEAAQDGQLITFGIIPDYPAIGYGYIEAGAEISDGIFSVTRFKEKPDLQIAREFLAQGGFFWNSGIFGWTIGTISEAFRLHQPRIHELCQEISLVWLKQGFAADISQIYSRMPRLPIDIGIMEKAEARAVIPVDIGWNDVGSFKALAEISEADKDGNHSQRELYSLDATGNYVHSDKVVALIGVNDLCIIETPDAILVTHKDRAEDVKHIVDRLKQDKREDLL